MESIEKQGKNILSKNVKGKLRCAVNKGSYQYYCGENYIPKAKKQYATQLAQRDYCLKLQKSVREYRQLLQKLQDCYQDEKLENVYRSLHGARKALVTSLADPIEKTVMEFEQTEYERKEFSEDNATEYYTVKGERVRSKSEKIIADELYRFQIPYKYEFPITLKVRGHDTIFHPDFTVLNKSAGKRWIIEHLGMMDHAEYYEAVMQKLEIYEKNDLLLGRDLIVFHETLGSPLSTKLETKYIEEYLV